MTTPNCTREVCCTRREVADAIATELHEVAQTIVYTNDAALVRRAAYLNAARIARKIGDRR